MTTSKTIAALLGPTMIVGALMVLANLDVMPGTIDELFKSPMLIVLAGYAAFALDSPSWISTTGGPADGRSSSPSWGGFHWSSA